MPRQWDIKQIGVGGGSVLGILFLFQSQGIDFMTRNEQTRSEIMVERTRANSERIERVERSVNDLNNKIDQGFESLRTQVRAEVSKLSDIFRVSTSDRYTKTEHDSYSKSVEARIQRLEDDMKKLGSK